ncbi:protein kinase [Nonomuraea sp. NPDC005983]|uniref:serine/threonine-protein kinase n=1 Tax=Nonomuraea sp. NPDC005983 TaxID=3155595 RepID=UPI0033B336E8
MVTPLTPDDPAWLGGYRLAGRIGEGGQGVVYLGHARDGQAVAVKLLSTGDAETRARLARELDALESIASFCTARVLDASSEGPRPYVVSEYVEGPSLLDRVRDRGPLRGGDLERLAVGTATALAAIHAAGVVHRDFKPANVLLGPDGPRVVDFGIARAEGAATMTSGLIGTPAYLSPEQIAGSPASPASDVFAWAATMVFTASGVSPFGADTVPAVLHRVLHAEPDLSPLPPRLRGLIAAALSKDPSRRPTARELMVALVEPSVEPGVGPGSAPQPVAPRPSADGTGPPQAFTTAPGRDTRGRSRGLLVAVVAMVAAVAAAGGVLVLVNRAPDQRGATVASSPAATGTPAVQTSAATSAAPSPSTATKTATATATATATGGQRIPAAFAGTWRGKADGAVLDREFKGEPVTITLAAGASTGTWQTEDPDPSADPGCLKGTLKLTDQSAAKLAFRLTGLTGTCAVVDLAGGVTVSLEKKPDGRAAYLLTMPIGGTSHGDLTRAR